jgi:hypothetical protein
MKSNMRPCSADTYAAKRPQSVVSSQNQSNLLLTTDKLQSRPSERSLLRVNSLKSAKPQPINLDLVSTDFARMGVITDPYAVLPFDRQRQNIQSAVMKLPAQSPYSSSQVSRNRPVYATQPRTLPPRYRSRALKDATRGSSGALGKENTCQNKPFKFYLEQVKTLNQMKSNLDEVSPVANDQVRVKLSKAVKHMEVVVSDFEK